MTRINFTALPLDPNDESADAGAGSASGPTASTDGGAQAAPSGPAQAHAGHRYNNIPAQMRALKQWAVSAPSTSPDKAPKQVDGSPASSTDPTTWTDFDTACGYAMQTESNIGFMLTAASGIVVIDLDFPKGDQSDAAVKDQRNRFEKILKAAEGTYIERSRSGNGWHIIGFGTLPNNKGRRRDGVELYTDRRYMIQTGDSVTTPPAPLANIQYLLDALLVHMPESADDGEEILDVPETKSMDAIHAYLSGNSNGQKYLDYFNGNWQQHRKGQGDQSQSSADLALMQFFLFGGATNQQAIEMFEASELAPSKRPPDKRKAKPSYYIQRTLRKARNQIAHDNELTALGELIASRLVAAQAARAAEQMRSAPRVSVSVPPLTYPPGRVGELAELFFKHSKRPAKDVSIIGALMFVTAPCGLRWQISDTGLNMYMVLVAMSGIGKDEVTRGIGWITKAIEFSLPNVQDRFVYGEMQSVQGLMKHLAKHRSILHISQELGQRFVSWNDRRPSAEKGLKSTMTRIYTKSASTMSAGGLHYSADEKTVADVGPVSYSVFGDTTPQVFNGACNGPMMEDGFLSRFGNVQYKGNRPPYVANPLKSIPQDVVTHWVDVFNHADLMDKGDNFIDIQIDNEANKLLNDFNEEIDRYFVDITDDALRQSRTRAHLKALKIAGLLAAADNPYLPKVSVAHAEWAIDFIRREIAHYDELVNAGDLCSGNDSAERKLKAILAEYIGEEPKASYRVRPELRKAGIVTWSYMMTRTSALPQFQKVNNINPLKGVVANLISEGVLTPVKVFPAGIAARGECYYVDIH